LARLAQVKWQGSLRGVERLRVLLGALERPVTNGTR
jgi:hypothetical protein